MQVLHHLFAASTFGIKPVLLAGIEEQKKAYGARLAEGQISAQCVTEPQSGSDMGNTKCRAVKDGDEYVIKRNKVFYHKWWYSRYLYSGGFYFTRNWEVQEFLCLLLIEILRVSA